MFHSFPRLRDSVWQIVKGHGQAANGASPTRRNLLQDVIGGIDIFGAMEVHGDISIHNLWLLIYPFRPAMSNALSWIEAKDLTSS